MIKVLVCDDEPEICELASDILGRRGFSVATAHDGEEALEQLRNNHFDVLLLDLVMPHMGGTEVLEFRDEFSDTAVIILTAHGDKESAIKAIRTNVNDYLEKPVDWDILVDTIKTHTMRLEFGEFAIDVPSETMFFREQPLVAPEGLYRIFELFMREPDRFWSYEDLVTHLFQKYPDAYDSKELKKQVAQGRVDKTIATNYLRPQVHRLRRQVLDAAADYEVISSRAGRGFGWSWQARNPGGED